MSDNFSVDKSLDEAISIRSPSSMLDESDNDTETDGLPSISHYNAADLVMSWTKLAPTTQNNSEGPVPPAEERFVSKAKNDPLSGKYTALIVVILVIVIISMLTAIAIIASRDSSSGDEEDPQPLTFPPLQTRAPEPSPVQTTVVPTTAPVSPQPTTIAQGDLKSFLIGVSFDSGAALADPSSPQFLAYNWLLNDKNLPGYSDARKIQRYVLATLYFSTDGDQWINDNGWLSNGHECDWEFTDRRDPCGSQDAVDIVVLSNNGLRGVLPPEIGLLSDSLLQIDLRGNLIFGSIPIELGFLENLRLLNLQDNGVSGSIPTDMGSLTNMLQFLLDINEVTGSIPSEIGRLTRLRLLALSQNRLVGPIATEIGLLVELETLLVNENDLVGGVPSELGELEELEVLDISNNNLIGSFPKEVCNAGVGMVVLDCREVLCDCCGVSCLQEYLDKPGD